MLLHPWWILLWFTDSSSWLLSGGSDEYLFPPSSIMTWRKPPTPDVSVFVFRAAQECIRGSSALRSVNTFCFALSLAEASTWALPPLNRKQLLAKRVAISQPVKTGHILFCVGLTLSSPELCSPLVTSQAWWNLYWCCLKGLKLIHCCFLSFFFFSPDCTVLNRVPLPQDKVSCWSWAGLSILSSL